MKTILIIFSLFILNSQFSLLNSTLWEVKQDGTGDFTTITAGINAAVSSDTLLVYPGIYYENINFSGKDIVLTSLYRIVSDDRRYIRETVIDGNQQGTVVTINSRETRAAVLSGFTIRNGKDIRVGGLFTNSYPTIRYCIIEHNHGVWGTGGILAGNGPILIGNTIRYNIGGRYGGVWFGGGYDYEFCNEELNSIYHNYGATGCDLVINSTNQSTIIIDTLTVINPSERYFIRYDEGSLHLPRDFRVQINHGLIEPIEADLFVSPDGCDDNSGLTPQEPLQRIGTALMRIQPDEDIRRTVYLAEGIYSHSLNNQFFPIGPRRYVDIVGADKYTTILDGEDKYIILRGINADTIGDHNSFTIKNMTLTRGDSEYSGSFGALNFGNIHNYTLENFNVTNNNSAPGNPGQRMLHFQWSNNSVLRNFNIHNNNINDRLLNVSQSYLYAENIRFHNNHSSRAGRIVILGRTDVTNRYHATFVNLEFTNNSYTGTDIMYTMGSQLYVDAKVRLINATISGNRAMMASHPTAIQISDYNDRNELSIYNSILWDNGGNYQVYFSRYPTYTDLGPDVLNVSHSLIERGYDSIIDFYDVGSIINWGEGNIDAEPMFVGEDINPDYPYMLSTFSPARGAGTLDIPGLPVFEFPEYDLAGNPRIVDGRIDMGAYQWHPLGDNDKVKRGDAERERNTKDDFNLRNFPNPVTYLNSERQAGQTRSSTGTTISFNLPEAGEVMIEIYNLKGQFVKRIFDAYIPKGEHNVFWDGRDERGRYVATGFYMYNLHINDSLAATGRATFIK